MRTPKRSVSWDEPPKDWKPDPSAPLPASTTHPEVVKGDTVARAELMINSMLQRFEQALENNGMTSALAKEAPNIARAAATLAGERRQLLKMQLKAAEALGLPQVLAFLRQLPPEKRAHVMRELEAMERGGSVLA